MKVSDWQMTCVNWRWQSWSGVEALFVW